MSKHRIVGTLVSGYFDNAHRLGRVESIRFPRKGRRAPIVTLRLHSTTELVEGKSWSDILSRYDGQRIHTAITSINSVLLADGEGWVDAAEFLEWSES